MGVSEQKSEPDHRFNPQSSEGVYILFFKIRLYPKKMFLLNILKIN
jgi:hypothetical protein